jgi:hypothetical protein
MHESNFLASSALDHIDHVLHAALRVGHRGGLVNAQRFLEQINRLIARAVERLDKLLHPLASLRESVRRQ